MVGATETGGNGRRDGSDAHTHTHIYTTLEYLSKFEVLRCSACSAFARSLAPPRSGRA